ncbi:unnamed protein product [Psylliodes chrysocephalus]|uniref:Purine nucleoside phosphorylase n=1 Tax=Psylliodes chrysocephalus TaxID=3402493 RepID=A0A9P0CDK3_9CUCU|nr:unnamed protein product [Psylliodes chrysocephala]
MGDSEGVYTYWQLEDIADFLKQRSNNIFPKVAIICGSGLSGLANVVENPTEINYDEIPNFPRSTVEGQTGSLVFGTIFEVPVIIMKGRFHFYEGYSLSKVSMPSRIFKLLGCSFLIITNAAGGVNKKYRIGDIMMIKDHINLLGFSGNNPLRGPNEDRFGDRFPPMNKCYDKDLRKQAVRIAKKLGLLRKLHQGVYANVGGPNYETVAEMKMLAICGVDAVGMSTIAEVIAARHAGLIIFGFSLISDEGILDYSSNKKEPDHYDVLEAVKAMEQPLQEFVKLMVKYIGTKTPCTCGSAH